MRANLSIMGMYDYDNTILDLMQIPEGIDKDTLKENLLMEAAELELLYSNFGFLKHAIGSWSRKQLPVWEELLATTQYEYNPIWNKDGTITELITRDLKGSEDVKDNNTRTDNLTDSQTRNLAGSNSVIDSHGVYGYNSDVKAPESEDVTAQGTTDTGTVTDTHTGTQADNRIIDRDTTDTGTIKTERTEQGNIGITSTQELIEAQRRVVEFNIIDIIIKDFIDRFCLKIY